MKQQIEQFMLQLQDDICQRLEALDGNGKFREDAWTREEGGGGRTRLIEEGALFERGGVNFSAVHGPASALMLQTLQLPARETPIDFYATGVSIVLHPRNPMVPIIHMNVRYFELSDGTYWFGGGIDLGRIQIREQSGQPGAAPGHVVQRHIGTGGHGRELRGIAALAGDISHVAVLTGGDESAVLVPGELRRVNAVG